MMANILVGGAVAIVVGGAAIHGQQPAPMAQQAPAPTSQAVAPTAPATDGLSDLDAMTFGCPKAGLNAAAREAAKVPSQGSYQFSYFKIISDSHHAAYEVHFKSNYFGEADLKYCVALYCQQGWDPKTTKTEVMRMADKRQPGAPGAHAAACGVRPAPVKHPAAAKTPIKK